MNAAILNADLPMPVRMKRARRRAWRIDRPDNINYVVQGALAYRQLAAPLAWEGTFEQNRAQPAPFTGFGDESTVLYMEGYMLQRELEDLEKTRRLELPSTICGCQVSGTLTVSLVPPSPYVGGSSASPQWGSAP